MRIVPAHAAPRFVKYVILRIFSGQGGANLSPRHPVFTGVPTPDRPARRSPAGGFLFAATGVSASGFPDPPGAVALGASGRIDSAAGLRGLLDRCEAGAAAGGALAFDRVRFALFHFHSQMTTFVTFSLHIDSHDLKDFSESMRTDSYL